MELILDTSSEFTLLAITEGQDILAQMISPHHNQLSGSLMPSIDGLIRQTCGTPHALTSVAIGVGPGSYTGTRIGVAVAKSLSFALQIPVKPFCSLFAFLPPSTGSFAAVIPTRLGAFFVAKGRLTPTEASEESGGLVSADGLLSALEDADFLVAQVIENTPLTHWPKPHFPLHPHLPTLIRFLATKETVPLEEIALIYLHSHIEKISPSHL